MDRFPIYLFPPSEHRWYVAGAPLIGGQPIAGPPQSADVAAGGWWVCEWSAAILRTRDQHAAWRAFLATLNSGVNAIEVPALDILQPWPGGVVPLPEPHSDGAPFADDSLYATEPIVASLAAAAYMPAWPAPATAPTQAQIAITSGNALRGGEYFSVTGPSGMVRMHMVCRVLSTSGDVSTVSLIPPFREDMTSGTAVDFNEPRCTMKGDVASIADAWPKIQPPFVGRPSIKFVEAF
ncbi:MAG: hypothetical protein P4L73_13385 [Caulobacteraceae bacterium]|nr:hypothetical protein [Caulobacteraceae bacterium]